MFFFVLCPTASSSLTLSFRRQRRMFIRDSFLDEGLADTQNEGLLSQADFIRYLSPRPRRLRGIHSVLEIEEATIIAVPDAIHLGWARNVAQPAVSALPFPSPRRPDWWTFLPCQSQPDDEPRRLRECEPRLTPTPESERGIPQVREPLWGNFLDSSIRVSEPPALSTDKRMTRTGILTLSERSSKAEPGFACVFEDAPTTASKGIACIYSGTVPP